VQRNSQTEQRQAVTVNSVSQSVPGLRARAGDFPVSDPAREQNAQEKDPKDVAVIKSISIPRVPIGPNSSQAGGRRNPGLFRMHWTRRRKYNLMWFQEVALALHGYLVRDRPERKCRLTITLHRRRLLDHDNAVASCKPVIDACRKCGLIYQDSPKWIDLQVLQVRDLEERTEIIVAEISDERA
jgi:hypothetical protein